MIQPTEHWIEIAPGIVRRTLVHGPQMMQILVTLTAGAQLPAHQHVNEQITHIISGRLQLVVDGVTHDLRPGESYYIGSNAQHSAVALEETLALDTFSPPREDMLAQDVAQRGN